jgi:AcrR family transcriptional regulator
MPGTTKGHGRAGQRRRTRKAILQAAMDLLAREGAPSIAGIAAAADVSRRTIYMYFPTLEHLLVDAALGLASQAAVDRVVEALASEGDVEARVDAMVRAVQRMSSDTEQLGRSLIRLTIEPRADTGAPRRGYRRTEWIESALAPLRDRLGASRLERLVSALSMVIGWEALLVQRDIRRLNPAEAEEVSAWAARALVRAALAELETAGPPSRISHRAKR